MKKIHFCRVIALLLTLSIIVPTTIVYALAPEDIAASGIEETAGAAPTESPSDPVQTTENPPEQSADDPAKVTDDPAKPTDDPAEPTDDPAEPTDDPAEQTDDPAESTDDPAEPTDDPTEPTDDPTEPTDDPEEGEEEIVDEEVPEGEGVLTEQLLRSVPTIAAGSGYDDLIGTEITVEGKFPEGAYVESHPVTITSERVVEGMNGIDEETVVDVILAFDITIYNDQGEVIQPDETVVVKINLPQPKVEELMALAADESAELSVVHVPDEAHKKPEVVASAVAPQADGAVKFEAEHFSRYAITVTTGDSNSLVLKYTFSTGSSDPSPKTYEITISNNGEGTVWLRQGDTVTLSLPNRHSIMGTSEATNPSSGVTISGNEVSGIDEGDYIYIRYARIGSTTRYYKVNFKFTASALTTVATVNSTAAGIIMNMTDHTAPTDIGGAYGNGSTKQGLVQRTLSNGYPRTTGGASLSGLFGRTPANYLFRMVDGYYYFNSAETFASFNGSTFTVYNQLGTPSNGGNYFYKRGNFMPYNTLNLNDVKNLNLYSDTGAALSEGSYRYGEPIYGFNQANNFYFGMDLSANFYMPQGGIVNGGQMIFEFTGDDDMWIFIDDVLTLDLGGIHDAQSGYINFATGVVGYTSTVTNGAVAWNSTTIKAMFQAALGSSFDETMFNGNTFADFTSHSFKLFYMERGAGASNLKIKFNLPTLPEGDIAITKQVENLEPEFLTKDEFTMQLYVNDEVQANTAYTVDGTAYATDSNGYFKLRHGQVAMFSGIKPNDKFYVVESSLNADEYDDVQFEMLTGTDRGTAIKDADGNIVGYKSKVYTYKYSDANSVMLTVKNSATSESKGKLQITKSFAGQITEAPENFVAEFTIKRLALGDGSFSDMPNTETITVNYSQFNNGFHYTLDVPAGYYQVTETIRESGDSGTIVYTSTSVVVAEGTPTNGTTSSPATVTLGGTTVVAFTNNYGETTKDIVVYKSNEAGEALAGVTFTLFAGDSEKSIAEYVTAIAEGETDAKVTIPDLTVDTLYRLKETPLPGYNEIADIWFKVTTGGVVLTDAQGNALEGTAVRSDVTVDAEDNLRLNVVNTSGLALPEAGGMGTTMFGLAGFMIALFGIMTFVTIYLGNKRRKNNG